MEGGGVQTKMPTKKVDEKGGLGGRKKRKKHGRERE